MVDNSSILSSEHLNTNKLKDESDYIEICMNAFKQLSEKDYQGASTNYKESLAIARKLEDDYKYADSLSNYGITQYYCGKITDSINNLENALRITHNLIKNTQEIKIRKLLTKILSNLFLSYLCEGKILDGLVHFENLLNYIKSFEKLKEQLQFLRHVIYIFFRVESLTNLLDKHYKYNFDINEKIHIPEEIKNSEEILQKISSKIMYFLHKYLREKDINSWIKCLSDESENYKLLKNYNGFVFTIFNQYASMYAKDPQNNFSKPKIANICRALSENKDFDEKSIIGILEEMKEKSKAAIDAYNRIYEMERDIEKKINQQIIDEKIELSKGGKKIKQNSKVWYKIFLKFALRYLSDSNNIVNEDLDTRTEFFKDEKYFSQLKNQLELTLHLIENNNLDLSSINLESIDPEMYESLVIVGENLLLIKYKSLIRKSFKKYRETIKKIALLEKRKNFDEFMTTRFQTICNGNKIFY